MEMTGKYCIHAPRDAVWTALNDTEILKHCLRGCERLERIDEFRMAGTVTTNANLTGHITSSGNAAVLGSFTSAQLATALTPNPAH